MTPVYPTLVFLTLVSQFKPNLANNHAQLLRRQAVNETCAQFCTPEILALNNLDHKANATTCTDAIGKQLAECTQCQNGYVTIPYGYFIEDCQKLGIPVKDISKLDGTVPNFNPSSSPSGVDSQLARVPQCAWLVAVVFSTGVFGLFRL